MSIHLHELRCPLCKGKDLEKLGKDKCRCRFCSLGFEVIDVVEADGEELIIDISEACIEYHHVASHIGEGAFITCPPTEERRDISMVQSTRIRPQLD